MTHLKLACDPRSKEYFIRRLVGVLWPFGSSLPSFKKCLLLFSKLTAMPLSGPLRFPLGLEGEGRCSIYSSTAYADQPPLRGKRKNSGSVACHLPTPPDFWVLKCGSYMVNCNLWRVQALNTLTITDPDDQSGNIFIQ